MRKTVALALIGTLLTASTAASAATKPKPKPKPKPVCNLVTDIAGDATQMPNGLNQSYTPANADELDILSGDIATDGTNLTAVVRVAHDPTARDPQSPLGLEYEFQFKVGGVGTTVVAVVGPTGSEWAGGNGTGIADPITKEIRVTVPLSKLPAVMRAPAAKFSDFSIVTGRWAGNTHDTGVSIATADTATGGNAVFYVAGTLSCVKVGV